MCYANMIVDDLDDALQCVEFHANELRAATENRPAGTRVDGIVRRLLAVACGLSGGMATGTTNDSSCSSPSANLSPPA